MDARSPDVGPVAVRRGLRGRRGGLKDMPNMPLDILVEIFSFLHPRDLLNLARTSRAFRAFLMSRSSAQFWKDARRTVEGLPDCPPYLSEPAYANLMFFPYCHVCLTNNIQNILFEFSARYCRRCKKDMLVMYDEYIVMFVETVRNTTNVQEEFFNLTSVTGKDSFTDIYLHRPEWDAFTHAWEAINDAEEATRLVEETLATVNLVQQACGPLSDWKDLQVQSRAEEIHGVRTERFNAILQFLRQEGWGEELDIMHEDNYVALSQTPFARKANKLTARSWRNISEDAHAFMADVQTARLMDERWELLQDRFDVLVGMIETFYGPSEVLRRADWDMDPTFIDFAFMPSFRQIWDAPHDGPVELNVTEPADISAAIESAIEDWKDALKAELVEKLRAAVPGLAGVEDPLTLAIAGFSCNSCGGIYPGTRKKHPLYFPELLAHQCLRSVPPLCSPDVYTAAAARLCDFGRGPLSLERIVVDPAMVQNLQAVVQAMSLDPLTATVADLNSCEVRLRCGRCHRTPHESEGDRVLVEVEAFDWVRAIEHHNTHRHRGTSRHDLGSPCRWRALGNDEARSVMRKEARLQALPRAPGATQRRLGCVLCAYNCRDAYSMMYHLREHGKTLDVAEIGQSSYDHLDNAPVVVSIWVHYLNAGGYVTVVA